MGDGGHPPNFSYPARVVARHLCASNLFPKPFGQYITIRYLCVFIR